MTKLAATEKSSGIIRRETGTEYRGWTIMVEMRPPCWSSGLRVRAGSTVSPQSQRSSTP